MVGFIEGDGSFSLERATFEPIFSIKLSETQASDCFLFFFFGRSASHIKNKKNKKTTGRKNKRIFSK